MSDNRRLIVRVLPVLAGAMLLLCFTTVPVPAADPIVGSWIGAVPDGKGHNIVAKLNVTGTNLGAQATMRWDAPKNCSLTMEYAGIANGKPQFRVASSDGGWCDGYRGGALDLDPLQGAVGFSLQNQNNAGVWKGNLQAAP